MKIFSGSYNLPLAHKISRGIQQPLGEVELKQFSNGETYARFPNSARGECVAIIQSFGESVDSSLMQACVMADALKRNGVQRITLVAPCLPYSRQERRSNGLREPITAQMVAGFFKVAGFSQIITVDAHNLAIEGFYDLFINVPTTELFVRDIRQNHEIENSVIVSPDAGGVQRARNIAKELKLDVAIIDKRREEANKIEDMRLIGEVDGKDAIIVDDIADTCGTINKCADLLVNRGAKSVRAYVTHGIFSGESLEIIDRSGSLCEMVVTDSILNEPADQVVKIRRLSVAEILVSAMRRAIER